jgi:hypothetical protein
MEVHNDYKHTSISTRYLEHCFDCDFSSPCCCSYRSLFGRNAEKKQAEQQKTMEANAQTINAFVIDKKKLKLKEAGLPSIVLEQSPKYARISKVPIVKVKAGPRVMNLIADPKVYEQILPKQDIKATVSGLYITSFKRIRGPIYEPPKKKKRFGRK